MFGSSAVAALSVLLLVAAFYFGLSMFLDWIYFNAIVDIFLIVTLCASASMISPRLRNASGISVCSYLAFCSAVNRQVLGVMYATTPDLAWDLRMVARIAILHFYAVEFILIFGLVAAFGPPTYRKSMGRCLPVIILDMLPNLVVNAVLDEQCYKAL